MKDSPYLALGSDGITPALLSWCNVRQLPAMLPNKHFLRGTGSMLLLSALLSPVCAQTRTLYSHGDPTALEQLDLEYINRARMNPAQEGILLHALNTPYSQSARVRKPSFFTNLVAEFAAYPAVPPIAFHPKLLQAARAHSQDMIDRGYFSHLTPENLAPADRVRALGYDAGVGENLDGGGAAIAADVLESHFALMVDYDNISHETAPFGHRLNVLRADYSEVGVGIRGPRDRGKITQDFGNAVRNYLLGVAFTDANGDGAYTPGEGLAGVTVTPDIGTNYAVTSASGGFALPIDPMESVTNDVPVPLAIGTNSWAEFEPYDVAYRRQQLQDAPALTIKLSWTGGALAAKRVTYATIKRPVLRNYHLQGTNGYYYPRSMVTTESVKTDLVGNSQGGFPGWELNSIYGWLWDAGDGWYGSEAFGWLWFTGNWAYSTSLKQWLGQTGASRTLWSPQFRWLTPSAANNGTAQTSTLGKIHLGKYNGVLISEGWVVSDRFGYVWANGDGVWFYSDRYEWLGVTPDGGVWCVRLGRFL